MPKSALRRYETGLRTGIRDNSVAFAYSLYATTAMAILAHGQSPTGSSLIWFTAGNIAAFVISEALASRLFTIRLRGESSGAVVLGSAMSPFSVGGALSAVYGVDLVTHGWVSWSVAPFAGTSAFILIHGVENTLARRAAEKAHQKDDDDDEDDGDDEDDDDDHEDDDGARRARG